MEKKKKNHRAWQKIITWILACAVLFTGGVFLVDFLSAKLAERNYAQLRERLVSLRAEDEETALAVTIDADTTDASKEDAARESLEDASWQSQGDAVLDASESTGTQEDAEAVMEAASDAAAEAAQAAESGSYGLVDFEYPDLDIDYDALLAINEEFVGWLYFPALSISYPIAQTYDDVYYVKHSFEKTTSSAGCIFLDYVASSDFSDYNSFIFGHNMKNGTMFGNLKWITYNGSAIRSNPYFYVYTQEGVHIYQLYAVYQTTSGSDRYDLTWTEEEYAAYVSWALENSSIDYGWEPDADMRTLTLSTCFGLTSGTSKRLLAHGAEIGYIQFN